MKLLVAVALLAGAFSSPALAKNDVGTGNEVLATCSDTEYEAFYMCLGFLNGVLGTVDTYRFLGVIKAPYCLPRNATMGQLKDVLVAYLKERPAERHQPAVVLTVGAMRDAFPCPAAPK